MISTARIQLIFFMILMSGVSALAFFIFKPYIGSIFLAAIIAIASHPFTKVCLNFSRAKIWLLLCGGFHNYRDYSSSGVFIGLALLKKRRLSMITYRPDRLVVRVSKRGNELFEEKINAFCAGIFY